MCDPQSVQYSYWLRLEDMAQWLPCFVEGLHLERFVAQGWVTAPLEWRGAGAPGCWWAPAGVPCEKFWAAARGADGRARPVAVEEHGFDERTLFGHQTGADALVAQFYTQEVADMVYEMYRPDFEAFGYERLIIDAPDAANGAGNMMAGHTDANTRA